jgi:HlyD family secretion protein
MKRSTIILLAIAALLLFASAVILGIRSAQSAGAQQGIPTPPPVTVPVTRGEVTLTVLAPGQLVSMREVVLGTQDGGLLEEILVRPGSPVRQGEVIARMRGVQEQILAPFDGVIAEVLARPGENLLPGQSLALLVDPQALEVRATVIEEDLPLVRVGQSAELYFDALPAVTATGQVTRIAPTRVPREDRPLYEVFLSLDAPVPGLLSGMTADAAIVVAEVKDALRLPRGVLRGGSGGTAVAKVWDGQAILERTVKVGLRGNAYIEILDGLLAGEQVVGE